MTILNGIILGLLQGLTEFLPVSSSGHFAILNNLFNIQTSADGHLIVDAMMRIGTLMAIIIVFWQEIVDMLQQMLGFANAGPLKGKTSTNFKAARIFLMILFASAPLLLILPIYEMLQRLSGNNIFIGTALILTGCATLCCEMIKQGNKTEKSMSIYDAIIIGLCQMVSVVPGLSRMGITYGAGVATGLKRDFAVKFAFLLTIPSSIAYIIVSLSGAIEAGIDWSYMSAYLVAMACSMVSGIVSMILMKKIVENSNLKGFGFYCLIAGVIFIILTLIF